MEKKTAVQEVFSKLEKLHPQLFNVYTTEGKEFINHFHKFLAIEKEQILDAFFYGTESAYEVPVEGVDDAEFYYNETFNK